MSDEVYEDFAYARPHLSPWSFPGMAERTIVVSSLSKSHAIPASASAGSSVRKALSGHLFNALICTLYGGPPFIQDGALVGLTQDLPEVAAISAAYRRRAGLLSGILADAPNCKVTSPEGGMFVLLDVRGSGLGRKGSLRPCSSGRALRSCRATASDRARSASSASR